MIIIILISVGGNMKNDECKKCGHKWIVRIADPKACPACKQYNWKKELKKKSVLTKQ